MTLVAQTTKANNQVIAACAQQQRLLRRFDSVGHYLTDLVAAMWLPGRGNTFDDPTRRVANPYSRQGERASRPILLTLEVTKTGVLNFTGAISRFRNDKLIFSPIFAYDVSMPFTNYGGGRVLPAVNLVLARRANDLLSALVRYGSDVSFGVQKPFTAAVFPKIVCDSNGVIFEDYAGVLGLRVYNPAKDIKAVDVLLPNPASRVLARHGLESIANCSHDTLTALQAEMRSFFTPEQAGHKEIVDFLSAPDAPVKISVPLEVAVQLAPEAAAEAIRTALPYRYQQEVSFNDLLVAAKNPTEDIKISRLSAVQICDIESVQDLPDGYAGTVLAPLDWTPTDSVINPSAEI